MYIIVISLREPELLVTIRVRSACLRFFPGCVYLHPESSRNSFKLEEIQR
jgi:hypothetical protein